MGEVRAFGEAEGGRMKEHDDRCEIWANGGWATIRIDEALKKPSARVMRCLDCGGQVRAHKAASNGGQRAHFEHHQRHAGCPRCDCFDGTPRPHPTQARHKL